MPLLPRHQPESAAVKRMKQPLGITNMTGEGQVEDDGGGANELRFDQSGASASLTFTVDRHGKDQQLPPHSPGAKIMWELATPPPATSPVRNSTNQPAFCSSVSITFMRLLQSVVKAKYTFSYSALSCSSRLSSMVQHAATIPTNHPPQSLSMRD